MKLAEMEFDVLTVNFLQGMKKTNEKFTFQELKKYVNRKADVSGIRVEIKIKEKELVDEYKKFWVKYGVSYVFKVLYYSEVTSSWVDHGEIIIQKPDSMPKNVFKKMMEQL